MASDAPSIYQDWLDRVFPAIMQGDFTKIAAHVSLPYLHQSQNARIVIETRKDIEAGFGSFMHMMRAQGINQYIGLATSAEYLSDDYIQGFHVVHSLRNGVPVLPPYLNRAVLRRGTHAWKLSEVHHGFAHGGWPITEIHVGDHPATARAQEDDARRESTQPLALYQRFLNRMTQANVSRDFDAYCEMTDFPYSYHSIGSDMIARGPEDVRPFFDTITTMLHENRIEEFARIADSAEFLSGSMICGYHTTWMLRDGKDALEPIRSRMILHRSGTRWLVKSLTKAVADDAFPYGQPVVAGDLVTDLEIQKRTKA